MGDFFRRLGHNLLSHYYIRLVICRYRGGPPIPRKLISQGFLIKSFSVEVYPLCLQLIDARDNTHTIIRISRKVLLVFLLSIDIFLNMILFYQKVHT